MLSNGGEGTLCDALYKYTTASAAASTALHQRSIKDTPVITVHS